MKKTSMTFGIVLMLAIFAFMATGCKKKEECSTDKCKLLMGKSWDYDSEAVRTEALTKAGEASGIKNLKDIKLKKDVKTMADAIMAKSLRFAYGKGSYSDKLVCGIAHGKGILKSERTGYWKLLENDSKIEMKMYKPQETMVYEIKELTANKLVILKQGSNVNEIYTTK